jgi:hypothetical protein
MSIEKLKNQLKYFPIYICVAVVAAHIYFVNNYHADKWKLGAFRMFSVIDERILSITGRTNDSLNRNQAYVNYNMLKHNYYKEDLHSYMIERYERVPTQFFADIIVSHFKEYRFLIKQQSVNLISDTEALVSSNIKTREVFLTSPKMGSSLLGKNLMSEFTFELWMKKFDFKEKRSEFIKVNEYTVKFN